MSQMVIAILSCLAIEYGVLTPLKRRAIVRSLSTHKRGLGVLLMPIYVPLVEPLIFTGLIGWVIAHYTPHLWLRLIAYGVAFFLSTMASIHPILEVEPTADQRRKWRGGNPIPFHKHDPNELLFSEKAGSVAVWVAWGSFAIGAILFWWLMR